MVSGNLQLDEVEEAAPGCGRIRIAIASEVTPSDVQWLLWNRIPLGDGVTLLEGDGGTNKSTLALRLAANVTAGMTLVKQSHTVNGGAVILTGEDSARTVTARLAAMGANLSRVAIVEQPVRIPDDLAVIEEAVRRVAARLIVIDPLPLYINVHSDAASRGALAALGELSRTRNLAVIAVRHLTKTAQNALYRGQGGIGIVSACRSLLVMRHHPDKPELRLLSQEKNNLASLAGTLVFRVRSSDSVAVLEFIGQQQCRPRSHLRSIQLARASWSFASGVLARTSTTVRALMRFAVTIFKYFRRKRKRKVRRRRSK